MARDDRHPDLRQCRHCACFNLRRAARAMTQLYDRAFQPFGLRATQFQILVPIASRGPINISDLAKRLVMDRTTLSRDLSLLEKRNWVKIRPGKDRRTRAIDLTVEGRRLVERALPAWQQAQAKIVEGLGTADFEDLLDNLSSTVTLAKAAQA